MKKKGNSKKKLKKQRGSGVSEKKIIFPSL